MEKRKDTDKYILIGLVSIVIAFLIYWTISSFVNRETQTNDFIKKEVGGLLVNIKDEGKGEYTLTIKQHKTGEILEYYLFLSPFIKKNNIQINDSISKDANEHTIKFYKKKNGSFYKCCELNY